MILIFNYLLGGLPEIRRAVIPMVMIYCSEVIWMKISESPKCIEKNLGKTRHNLLVLFSRTDRMWDNIHRVLSTRGTHLSLDVQFLVTLILLTGYSFFNWLPQRSN